MLSSNLAIIQRRWPDLAEWLGQYQPASFQTRKETPFTTLIIDNIHLAALMIRTLKPGFKRVRSPWRVKLPGLTESAPAIWQKNYVPGRH